MNIINNDRISNKEMNKFSEKFSAAVKLSKLPKTIFKVELFVISEITASEHIHFQHRIMDKIF